MLLYTLVGHSNDSTLNHKLLGSTFESDVAIFLYYTNIKNFDNLYFIFTKTEFNDFDQFSDFTQEPLNFFVETNESKITKLSFDSERSIFRLKSDYYTESFICSESEEKQLHFSDVICCYEKEKENLLPTNWEIQDDEFFEHHYEAEVLYVSVLTYQIGNEDSITCLAGASYHEQTSALLLDKKIQELKPDWCHYYFKPLFILKNQIARYLEHNQLKFCSYSEDPEKKLALIPLEKEEKHVEAKLYTCEYKTLTSVDENEFEDFIEDSWDIYSKHFEIFAEEDSFDKELEENLSKEDIITTYISELHKYYLEQQNDWLQVISLLKDLSMKDNIELALNCNLFDESAQYTENFESAFVFLKDCIQISKDNELYDDLAIGLLIKQKTGLKANNIEIKRIAGFILHRDGIFSLNENEVIDFIREETDSNFYIEEKAKYMSSEKLASILNLNINLQ